MFEILAIPDRLPGLFVVVGFWIPPALVGWIAAEVLRRRAPLGRSAATWTALATFVLGYATAWFIFNLFRMPPNIPGATIDPTFAPPEAVAWFAIVAGAIVLPGSAVACWLTFRRRERMLRSAPTSPASHECARRNSPTRNSANPAKATFFDP